MNTTASDIFNAHEIKELRQAGMKRIGNCLNDMFPVENFDPKLIAELRKASPSMIAVELNKVQPMPEELAEQWDQLGEAYTTLVASHGKGAILPLPNESE